MTQHTIYLVMRISGHTTMPVVWRATLEEAEAFRDKCVEEAQEIRDQYGRRTYTPDDRDTTITGLSDQTIRAISDVAHAFYFTIAVSDDSSYTQGGSNFHLVTSPTPGRI